MKRLLLTFIMIATLAGTCSAGGLGLGGYGGLAIPIVQDDQGQGTVFGLKAKLKLVPGFTLEPNLNFLKYGEAEFPFGNREGSKVTYFGADLILGGMGAPVGPKVYLVGGAGIYSTTRDFDEDTSRFGFSFGLGIEIGLGATLGLDFRGKGHVIPAEGGGSRKLATVTGGLNYYLGM
jgi:hypothetical protein